VFLLLGTSIFLKSGDIRNREILLWQIYSKSQEPGGLGVNPANSSINDVLVRPENTLHQFFRYNIILKEDNCLHNYQRSCGNGVLY